MVNERCQMKFSFYLLIKVGFQQFWVEGKSKKTKQNSELIHYSIYNKTYKKIAIWNEYKIILLFK